MLRRWQSLFFGGFLALLSLAATCDALAPKDYERYASESGLLIGEGDVDLGRAVFIELRCHSCHSVDRITLPPIESPLSRLIALGGEVDALPTDAYLATAVINPSHDLAQGYPRELVSEKGSSRMADYGDYITIHQLRDLVAFLHTRYRVPNR
jgi:L-cysteine S-thiosulfotransferase